jgi:hypothetical protein
MPIDDLRSGGFQPPPPAATLWRSPQLQVVP